MTMVIDFRPPTPHFLQYFDTARVTWLAERVGAKGLAPSFVNASMDLFWEEMDEAGIDIGVVLGRNSPAVFMGKPFKEAFIPNEHVAELQAQYPRRIVGYGGIDASNTRHDAVVETARCVEKLGLKGIFIEPGRQLLTHPADPMLDRVYEACVGLNAPVVVMSGPYAGADIQSSHPVYIDQVATRFPDLKIVVGHGAWPWIDEMHGVAFKHPNVFVSPDLYFFVPGGNRYVEAMRGALKDQFLFGTAYPLRPLVQTVEDCRAFDLDEKTSRKFFSENAKPLLGLNLSKRAPSSSLDGARGGRNPHNRGARLSRFL